MAVNSKVSFPRKRESNVRWIPAFAGMTAVLILATACGVRRPLISPSEAEAKAAQEVKKEQR